MAYDRNCDCGNLNEEMCDLAKTKVNDLIERIQTLQLHRAFTTEVDTAENYLLAERNEIES
jgi:hypothetical protein